jgi:hypothetical protein
MDGTVADFVRAPEPLLDPPESLLEKHATQRRGRRKQGATPDGEDAPRARKRAEAPITGARPTDTCHGDADRAGYCRRRVCGRIVAVPPLPRDYSEDLEDTDRELLVVEMQPARGAPESAWLHDEAVEEILVRSGDADFYVGRNDLKLFVNGNVELIKTRQLCRAIGKICSPLGGDGPVVTLVRLRDLFKALPAAGWRPAAA